MEDRYEVAQGQTGADRKSHVSPERTAGDNGVWRPLLKTVSRVAVGLFTDTSVQLRWKRWADMSGTQPPIGSAHVMLANA